MSLNYYAKEEDDLAIKSTSQSSEVTGYFNTTYNSGLIRKNDYKFTMKDGTYVKEKYDLNFNSNVKVEMPSGYNSIAIL